ncbi:TPA: response regulator transcription factor [Enterococcus faecium]|nr:response regulator transcription factor [Enterococcus faecium]
MVLLETILIIEDDEAVHSLLEEVLEQRYKLLDAYSGTEGKLLLSTYPVDLILLDLMLPGLSGEALLAEIRQTSNVPIIVLSAKSDQRDKVSLLVAGADDYVTKPFDIEELLLRIGIQLRHQTSVQVKDLSQRIYYKEILLDKESRDVNGVAVHLTGREFDLLKLFLEHPKKVFSRANLYETVWQEPYFDSEKTVNMHISNLRGKLAKAHAVYIHTVWGVGFRFD